MRAPAIERSEVNTSPFDADADGQPLIDCV
jgi:hypothetical protein